MTYFKNHYMMFLTVLVGMLAYEQNIYNHFLLVSSLFIVLFCINTLRYKLKKININPFGIIFILFYALCYITSIIYNKDITGLFTFIFSVIASAFYALNNKLIDDYLKVIIILSIPPACISLLLQFTDALPSIWSFVVGRNSSIYFDPNFASVFMSLAAIASLIYISKPTIKVVLFSLFSLACFFTFSKGGIIALIIGVLAYLLNRLKFIQFVLLAILLSYFAYLLFKYIDVTMFRIEQGFNERDSLWSFSIEFIFNHNNFLGIGKDNLTEALREYGFSNTSTHSFYFDTLLSYGVLPFALNIILVLSSIFSMYIHKVKLFPILVVLFIQSNVVLISVGGLSLLSSILSILVISQLIQTQKNPKTLLINRYV